MKKIIFIGLFFCATWVLKAQTPVTTTGGNAYYLTRFSGASTVVNSLIYDNGTNIGIGTPTPISKLNILDTKTAAYSPTTLPTSSVEIDNYNNSLTNLQYSSIGFRAKGISGGNTSVGAITLVQPDRFQNKSDFTFTLRNSAGSYNEIMKIQSEGYVGIGTTTPTSTLHLKGNNNNFTTFALKIDNSLNNPLLYVTNSGVVGIGTILQNNPNGYLLAVKGIIGARELVIETTSTTWWPDYVFDNKYDLLQLKDVESFIKLNKHLPDVPSASEIGENGIAVGEMNKVLLKKIEELYLYVIQMQKEIELLKANN